MMALDRLELFAVLRALDEALKETGWELRARDAADRYIEPRLVLMERFQAELERQGIELRPTQKSV